MHKSRRRTVVVKNRRRGAYRSIGLFFIIVGTLLMVNSGVCYALYRTGVIFQEPLYVPPIPGQTSAHVITSFDPTYGVQKQLQAAHIVYKTVDPVNDWYKITLASGETVLFSQKKDIATQIASLQLIINELTIEGKGFKQLDFRFDKPVIDFR